MKPYFQDEFVTLYHGDARTTALSLGRDLVVLTGPPWVEHYDVACSVIASLWPRALICQWTELNRPPCPLPLVAAHIWINADAEGLRYQPFYHFTEDGGRKRSAIFQYPDYERTHPHDFPMELAQALLMKAPRMDVFDPFCGSGATLLAARSLKRKAVGIEIDEKRCEMAAKRLSDAR